MTSISIPLTRGLSASVSPEDADLAELAWYAQQSGRQTHYAARRSGGKSTSYLHRIVADRMGLPANLLVDHEDGNSLNNRRSNLRPSSALGNARNRAGANTNSKTGVLGVHATKSGRYSAWIGRGGPRPTTGRGGAGSAYLGTYDTLEEAVAARKDAECQRYGEFAAAWR